MLVLLDQLGLDCMMKMGNRRESLHIYIYTCLFVSHPLRSPESPVIRHVYLYIYFKPVSCDS